MHPFVVVVVVVFFFVSPHIGGHTPPSHVILHYGVEARRRHRTIPRGGRRETRHEGESGRVTGLPLVMVPWCYNMGERLIPSEP